MKILKMSAVLVLSLLSLPALANLSCLSTNICEKGELTSIEYFKPDLNYGVLAIFEQGSGGFPVNKESFEGSAGEDRRRTLEFGKRYWVCGEMTSTGFTVWELKKR